MRPREKKLGKQKRSEEKNWKGCVRMEKIWGKLMRCLKKIKIHIDKELTSLILIDFLYTLIPLTLIDFLSLLIEFPSHLIDFL